MPDSPNVRRRSNRGSDRQHTGYTSMDDQDLEHSGVRGGRSCCLCTVIVILLLVAILNALVTAGLIYFLSITHEGLTDMEFFPGGRYLRVLSDIGVENLTIHEELMGRNGNNLNISGREVTVGRTNGAQVTIDGNKTCITSNEFELTTTDGKPLFKTSSPLNLDLYQVKNLHAPAVDVGSIKTLYSTEVTSSRQFPDLLIESFHEADVMGMEGVQVDTQGDIEIVAAENDIVVNSLEESLEFSPKEGIFLNPNLPLDGKGSFSSKNGNQYKLCVCSSNGRVFAVPDQGPKSGCHLANEDKNPCED